MSKINIFNQPKAFFLIFSIELWERFGFYGLNAILPLYLSKELGLSKGDSAILFSVFSALLYSGIAIGGWIGDKVLGTKRTIIFSAFVLMIGYLVMAMFGNDANSVYFALSIIAIGAGLFKSNPSALLSTLYEKNDSRIDGAFTMYYMSINIGSCIAMFLTPYLSSHDGLKEIGLNYTVSFGVSVVGLLITLLNFIFMLKMVKNYGSEPDFKPLDFTKLILVSIGTIVAIFICYIMLKNEILTKIILSVMIIGILAIFFYEMFKMQGLERSKMAIALVFSFEIFVFFVMYQQMFTSINFFTINNVEPYMFGIKVDPQMFQNLNPLYIIILSPLLAMLYQKLGDKLSLAYKISLGVLISSLGFLVLYFTRFYVDESGMLKAYWVELAYFFISFGELLTSALGLSMVAQLVPNRLMGFAMGTYFLSSSAATYVGGYVAAYVEKLLPKELSFKELESLSHSDLVTYKIDYVSASSEVFLKIFIVSALVSVLFVAISPMINKILRK